MFTFVFYERQVAGHHRHVGCGPFANSEALLLSSSKTAPAA